MILMLHYALDKGVLTGLRSAIGSSLALWKPGWDPGPWMLLSHWKWDAGAEGAPRPAGLLVAVGWGCCAWM